jgi:methionine aminotransferase
MVSSFGKSFHVTGWKGLFSSARIFDERNQKVHQFFFFVNSICQVAISEYLDIVSVSEIKLYQENGIIR